MQAFEEEAKGQNNQYDDKMFEKKPKPGNPVGPLFNNQSTKSKDPKKCKHSSLLFE